MQSILTGLLQVNLDYIDEAEPANARNRFEHDGSSYPIIPAVKSDIQEAKQGIITAIANFSETDFNGIADRLSKLIETLTTKFEELKPAEINEAVVAMRDRIKSEEIDEMLKSFSDAGAKFAAVAEKIDKQVGDDEIAVILKSTKNAMAAAESAMDAGETAVRSIGETSKKLESMTDRDAAFRAELEQSIKDIGDAAKRVSELAAYLSEHPNSVIFGKRNDTDDPDTKEKPRKFPAPGGKRR
ncbi:MAG: paraquat-inducible protein B [Verrucomicrobiales bacterium]|jgi:paraquat-inducible protein B